MVRIAYAYAEISRINLIRIWEFASLESEDHQHSNLFASINFPFRFMQLRASTRGRNLLIAGGANSEI